MLADGKRLRAFGAITAGLLAALGQFSTAHAQSSTAKRPAPTTSASQTPTRPAPTAAQETRPGRPAPAEQIRVADRNTAPPPLPETSSQAAPIPRDPARKVAQVASLTPEEVKEKTANTLRRSVTVYVPKLVMERQNVARTVVAPVTSRELRPVWSPGQGRWVTYQQTGQTLWTQQVEVVPMDVPVWKYVAETRYIEEPVAQRSYYMPTQTAPANASPSPTAWAWKTPGPGVQPVIPPYTPSSTQRPLLTFLQNRPIVGPLFGGNRPMFSPPPAPYAGVAANYQPVSYYTPNASTLATPNFTPPASGVGIPSFTAPPLPTAGATGSYGGVRAFN